MAKEEWGTKRVCPATGKRFYDLGRTPIVSPYTGEVVEIDTGSRTRSLSSDKSSTEDKSAAKVETESEEDAVVLEEDDDSADVDLGDEVLEDDDDDTVALDDIADVASDDDES